MLLHKLFLIPRHQLLRRHGARVDANDRRRHQCALQGPGDATLQARGAGDAAVAVRRGLQVFGALPLGCGVRQPGVDVLQQRDAGVRSERIRGVLLLSARARTRLDDILCLVSKRTY